MELDKGLVEKVKGLKLVFGDEPQPELLIPIPNRNKEVAYFVQNVTEEFTSLCPLNPSQPDYAKVTIDYEPLEYLVELKSLKFYLASFRMCPIFHEQIPARILNDLVSLLKPSKMLVTGDFTIRGGIHTTVQAEYLSPKFKEEGR